MDELIEQARSISLITAEISDIHLHKPSREQNREYFVI